MKRKRDYLHNPLDLSGLKLPMEIDRMPLDDWQKEVMDYEGSIAIRSGRQVGKSAIVAKKAAHTALKKAGLNILVTASSERQAAYIYEKIKFEFKFLEVDVFAETPTMRRTLLKNGSCIFCLPTGKTGDLIRGLTLDIWIPDEAAYIPNAVWASVSPMLWISKKKGMGWIWALSTPFGKQGKFYDLFSDEEFKTWHIKSIDCSRIPLKELEKWKRNYTRIQYAQEVLGEFIDDVSRFFPEDLLKNCFKKEIFGWQNWSRFLGVDVARYGGDENAFVCCASISEKAVIFGTHTTARVGVHDTFKRIADLETQYNFKNILVDDAGVGGGLTDFLLEKFRNKVIGLNNSRRSVSVDGKTKKQIFKQDLYSNALMMMERGAVDILENDNLYLSLASMLFEYDGDTLKIYGRYSHLAEAFVRALWGARKKGLKLFCA